MQRGDLDDFKLKITLGKTPIVYLNQASDFPQWEIALRHLVKSYQMAENLLYSMPIEEARKLGIDGPLEAPAEAPNSGSGGSSKKDQAKEQAKAEKEKEAAAMTDELKADVKLKTVTDPKFMKLVGVTAAQDAFFSSSTVFLKRA